jgi:hypothetical protein
MKTSVARSQARRAFTRRELQVGGAVVLALLGLAAVEIRKSSAPACGPGCASCDNQINLLLEWSAAGASNPPSRLAPGPTNGATR